MRPEVFIGESNTGAGRRWHVAGWAVVFFLLVFAPGARANTTLFTNSNTCTYTWSVNYCSSGLSLFGVLSGQSGDGVYVGTSSSNTGWTFNGGIGIRTGAELSSYGTANTANSIVDFADAVSTRTDGTCTGSANFCKNGGQWDSGTLPTRDQAVVNDAADDLANIINKLLTYSGTGTSISNSTLTFNIESGVTPGGLRVYRANSYSPTGALTFGCGGKAGGCNPNDMVLIYLTGSTSINYSINLTDGLTPDQVVFFSPNNNISLTPAVSGTNLTNISGTFIVGSTGSSTNRSITVGCTSTSGGGCDQVNLNGRLYDYNGNITFNNRGGVQDDAGFVLGPTPEPGTWALMTSGLGLVIWGAWKKKRTGAISREE